MKTSIEREQKLFDALKRISKDFDSSERILKGSQDHTGLDPMDALQMAYDNLQATAAIAIKGMRRPK